MADNREELGLRSIDSILDGHASPDPLMDEPPADKGAGKPEGKAEPAPAAKAEPDAGKGKADAKPKTADDDVEGKTQAVVAERRRRQEAERERDELRARLAEREKTRPDPKADPDGARRYAQAEAEEAAWQREAARSAAVWAEVKPYYAEKEAAFIEAVNTADPATRERMRIELRSAIDPGLHAYNEGKRILAQKEIGDPASYRERLLAEEREKIRAELLAEYGIDPDEKAKPAVPKSIARMPSAGPRDTGKSWEGPTALDKILA